VGGLKPSSLIEVYVYVDYHTKNSGSAGLVPAPILPKIGRSRPKFPERCYPFTSPRIPNFVRIDCALPDLYRKEFSDGKVNTTTAYN